MKPAFSYYGASLRIIKIIVKQIEAIPHTVYVEPFCGSASALFANSIGRHRNACDYMEVINDVNDLVINFYRMAVKCKQELLSEIQATLYSQSDYRKSCEICRNPGDYTDIEKAWAFYVSINQGFNNTLFRNWSTGVYGRNLAATWSNRKLRLESALDRLSNCFISSEDAIKCILRWDSPQTIFYCDPPYPGANQGHYSGYPKEDWDKLCLTLDGIQGSYVLKGTQQDVEPASHQNKIIMERIKSANGKGITNKKDKSRKATQEELGDRNWQEILWTCDRSHKIRKELVNVSKYRQLALL